MKLKITTEVKFIILRIPENFFVHKHYVLMPNVSLPNVLIKNVLMTKIPINLLESPDFLMVTLLIN